MWPYGTSVYQALSNYIVIRTLGRDLQLLLIPLLVYEALSYHYLVA